MIFIYYTPLVKCITKKKFLFLNQNICCGYSKEPSQRDSSFEYPEHMLKVKGKKILSFLPSNILFSKPVYYHLVWSVGTYLSNIQDTKRFSTSTGSIFNS